MRLFDGGRRPLLYHYNGEKWGKPTVLRTNIGKIAK
jgi:hypothetical protein